MRLAEYSDDELIEELKHRGIKIEAVCICGCDADDINIIIGGVVFDLK